MVIKTFRSYESGFVLLPHINTKYDVVGPRCTLLIATSVSVGLCQKHWVFYESPHFSPRSASRLLDAEFPHLQSRSVMILDVTCNRYLTLKLIVMQEIFTNYHRKHFLKHSASESYFTKKLVTRYHI